MHRLVYLLLATLLTTTAASSPLAESEQGTTPVGVWMHASERVEVEITPCGERFCGRIVWLSWLDDPQDMPMVGPQELESNTADTSLGGPDRSA
jgi:uncharacterized protein (DUF2147 family)